MNRTLILAMSAAATIAAVPALAQQGDDGTGRKISAATLTGAAERPNPGDPDGAGTFSARINPGTEELCYKLTATNIVTATAAHIHVAGPNVAGPVVVPLQAPASGSSETCVKVERGLAQRLIRNPENYYVNVHNAAFPGGAIRAQLSK